MTDWQIRFAADFWMNKLAQNAAISQSQLTTFQVELTGVLRRRKPSAVCVVHNPQANLTLALRLAEIPVSSMPLMEVDMVFNPDGSIQIRDGAGSKWVTQQPEQASTVKTQRHDVHQ